MKKSFWFFAVVLFGTTFSAFGQNKNTVRPKATHPIDRSIHAPSSRPNVPNGNDPFGAGNVQFKTVISPTLSTDPTAKFTVLKGEQNLPIFIEATNRTIPEAIKNADVAAQAQHFLATLPLTGIKKPSEEFIIKHIETDNAGDAHVRMEQVYKNLPVYGAEIILHSRRGIFDRMNGRYASTPTIENVTPALGEAAIEQILKAATAANAMTAWTPAQLKLVNNKPFRPTLTIYENSRLAYHVVYFPNPMRRLEYFVDAHTGEVLHHFDNTCNFVGPMHKHASHADCTIAEPHATNSSEDMPPPPITGSGMDLLGVNRSFGAFQVGSTVYMEDASKSMYNASASNMPNEPVGVIVTLDGLNNSPQNNNFDYTLVTSNSTTFSNKQAAVSAHYNSGKCFDYFSSAFSRNSIDGAGGNIIAFVNVAEDDGSSMENAFWNGEAMWYGNGGSTFFPLAKGLDVGGHEMTHGVIEKTANLIYQNESGALNESFADIFAAMIDSADWKIGEDVVKPGISAGGCLRSLQDPHNASTTNSNFWQPKHTNEQYTGSGDNGGVHINSGITNHAFYLFAISAGVGKLKAQQVYYKALKDYLGKSSKFIDCRVAVVQAATDLYGASVADAAAVAFSAVGIGSGGGSTGGGTPGNYLGTLTPNPGSDLVLATTIDQTKLQIYNGSGTLLGDLYTSGISNKPSVTDDGTLIVFTNTAGHIIAITLSYAGTNITIDNVQTLSDSPDWGNVAISKDGRFLAARSKVEDNLISVFDFDTNNSKDFALYNPTYSNNGAVTNNVKYADVLEFDYSSTWIMYDAFNELTSTQGQDLSYWDIGFLKFFENNALTDGVSDIQKLFSGLPENVSVGNPSLSKNSPYIIAFDWYNENDDKHFILGSNVENGDTEAINSDNGDWAVPNYTRLDNAVLHENNGNIRRQPIAANKIQASGSSTAFISNRQWPVWFSNGVRSLSVAVEDLENGLELTASPNPAYDNVQLNYESTTDTDAQVSLIGMDGKQVLSQHTALTTGRNTINIPLANLPNGVYVLRLMTGKASGSVKIVKY